MGEKRWTEPTESAWERWERLIVDDAMDPSTAAKQIGFTCSAFRRSNETRQKEILAAGRTARAEFADEKGDEWALADDASDQIRIAWLKRHNPEWSGAQKVELSGADGGPIEVEDRSASLADVLRVLHAAAAAEERG